MSEPDDRVGIPLPAIARLYGLVAIVAVLAFASAAYTLIPAEGGDGTEVSATVFADVRELRVEELPRSMTIVFERSSVLDRANRALVRDGLTPVSSLDESQTDFDPIEGTPFARVVTVDQDPERAEAVATAFAAALVAELNSIGPTFGQFEVLPQLLVEDQAASGLSPIPRMIVAVLAGVLGTAALLIALFAVFRPAVQGAQLPFPVVTIVNTARSRRPPELADLIGAGRVAELIAPVRGPVYLASRRTRRSIRQPLASRLAGRLDVAFVDGPELAQRGSPALGELELNEIEDVGHRLVGQDARIVLLAREGSRLRPLLALAEQFPPESVVGIVVERRRRTSGVLHVVRGTSSDRSGHTSTDDRRPTGAEHTATSDRGGSQGDGSPPSTGVGDEDGSLRGRASARAVGARDSDTAGGRHAAGGDDTARGRDRAGRAGDRSGSATTERA